MQYKMFEVYAYDHDLNHIERSKEIIKWAGDNCKSFIQHQELDLLDVSVLLHSIHFLL